MIRRHSLVASLALKTVYIIGSISFDTCLRTMMDIKLEALLLRFVYFLVLLMKQNYAQLSAVIAPRGYNASLDPEASFTFQCDVTGTI